MLSCECDFYSDDWLDWWYYQPEDFSTLQTTRRKRCVSCNELIDIGSVVVEFERFRHSKDDIEERCKGDEVQLASWYMCEKCGEQALNLLALGFCVELPQNMFDLLKEYHEMTGFEGVNKTGMENWKKGA